LFDLIVIRTPAEIIYVAQLSLQFYVTLRRLSGFGWLELLERSIGRLGSNRRFPNQLVARAGAGYYLGLATT
jgi:hypothetical protein